MAATASRIPTLYAVTDPAAGTATLWYDVRWAGRSGWTGRDYRVAVAFRTRPWSHTGLQPFAWDYVPSFGNRAYPVVRVMALRDVEMSPTVEDLADDPTVASSELRLVHIDGSLGNADRTYIPGTGEAGPSAPLPRSPDPDASVWPMPSKTGNYAVFDGREDWRGPVAGREAPMLQVIRPQLDAPFAHPDMRIDMFDLLRPPYAAPVPSLSTSNRAKRENRAVYVSQHRTGVLLQQVGGKYLVDIRICDPLLPAAFFYHVVDPEESERNDFRLLVIHNWNVEVTVKTASGQYDKVSVFAKRVGSPWGAAGRSGIDDVPWMGDEVTDADLAGNVPVRPDRSVGVEGLSDIFVEIVDGVLGFVPLVSDIYDLGQFAWAAATGRDFWGREVDGTELLLLGAAAILPLGLPK